MDTSFFTTVTHVAGKTAYSIVSSSDREASETLEAKIQRLIRKDFLETMKRNYETETVETIKRI